MGATASGHHGEKMQPIASMLQRDNCLIELGAKWNGGTNAFYEMLAGEPDVKNAQDRFDEGEQWNRHLRQPPFSTLLECLQFRYKPRGSICPNSSFQRLLKEILGKNTI